MAPWEVLSPLAIVWLLLAASGGVEHGACRGTAETSGGALVGKLEGPEVVPDPAHFPTSYNESPTLSELVKTGKLPAVKDRIGTDPWW